MNSKQKGSGKKKRDESGKFVRNTNVWKFRDDDIMECYLGDEMLFFTDDKRVLDYTWAKLANGYAATFVDGDIIPAHRFISQPMAGEIVDHINRDKKDNRSCNLRNTDKSMNAYNTGLWSHNTSGNKGVILRKDTGRWSARIMLNQKTIYLGCFSTKEEAIAARQAAERVIYASKQPKEGSEIRKGAC